MSRLLAVESGEWKAGDGSAEPRVVFDRDDYLRYRDGIQAGVERTRARFGGAGRFVDIEYRQLIDHAFVEDLLLALFGERIAVEDVLADPATAEGLARVRASFQAAGGRAVEKRCKEKLGVEMGETTVDRRVTLEPVYCLGNCACSPSIRIDDEIHARVSPSRFDELIELLREEG